MAGALTGLHVFANDVGPESLSLLDGNFTPVAAQLNTLANFANYYVDSGAVNALAVTVSTPQVVSYVDGLPLSVAVANTTTSATPTLAVNALGARTVVHSDQSALAVGELTAGMRIAVVYDGTNNVWRLQSPTLSTLSGAGANPTATVGLAAVNGAALTFMRSDAAAPLSQAISPTWTGTHVFAGPGTVTARNDTGGLFLQNTATTPVVSLTTVKGWTGSGTNVTGTALGAAQGLNLYTAGSTAPCAQLLTSNDILGRGIGVCKTKAATTSRASTTTATADPDLQYSIPATGTWMYIAALQMIAAAGSGTNPGIKVGPAFSGTLLHANGAGNSAVGFMGNIAIAAAGALNTTTNYGLDSAFEDSLVLTGSFTATGLGVFSISWAQQTSNASASEMLLGSSLILIQVS